MKTNEKIVRKIMQDNFRAQTSQYRDYISDVILDALVDKDSSNQWVSVEEFLKNPTEDCWAMYCNELTIITYDLNGKFYADDNMFYEIKNNTIKMVVPITSPQPPKGAA